MSPLEDSPLGAWLGEFWRDSRMVRWASLGAAVVVVLGLAGLGVWKWQDVREQRASAALAQATQLLPAPATPGAPPTPTPAPSDEAVRALAAVLAQYSGSPAGAQAAYRLGNIHYAAGRWPEARGAFEVAAASAKPGALRGLAILGTGYGWEGEAQWAKAEAVYRALANDPANGFLQVEALIALARTQERAGNRAGALATWEQIRKDHPDSRPPGEIEARIASLQGPGGGEKKP